MSQTVTDTNASIGSLTFSLDTRDVAVCTDIVREVRIGGQVNDAAHNVLRHAVDVLLRRLFQHGVRYVLLSVDGLTAGEAALRPLLRALTPGRDIERWVLLVGASTGLREWLAANSLGPKRLPVFDTIDQAVAWLSDRPGAMLLAGEEPFASKFEETTTEARPGLGGFLRRVDAEHGERERSERPVLIDGSEQQGQPGPEARRMREAMEAAQRRASCAERDRRRAEEAKKKEEKPREHIELKRKRMQSIKDTAPAPDTAISYGTGATFHASIEEDVDESAPMRDRPAPPPAPAKKPPARPMAQAAPAAPARPVVMSAPAPAAPAPARRHAQSSPPPAREPKTPKTPKDAIDELAALVALDEAVAVMKPSSSTITLGVFGSASGQRGEGVEGGESTGDFDESEKKADKHRAQREELADLLMLEGSESEQQGEGDDSRSLTRAGSIAPSSTPSPPSTMELVEVIKRMATVRYFAQMNPGKVFPLSVKFTKEKLQEWRSRGVAQVSGDKAIEVTKDDPFVTVRPHFPGCHVTPAERRVDLTAEESEATFTVSPFARGNMKDACVQVLYQGAVAQTIATPTRITTQMLSRVTATASFLTPAYTLALQATGTDLTSQAKAGFPLIGGLVEQFGLFNLGLIGGAILLVAAGLFFWWKMPKQSDPLYIFYNGPGG
ncbi:MAG: hypothetical protein AB7K09_05055 [Planctomycetota bacterium]